MRGLGNYERGPSLEMRKFGAKYHTLVLTLLQLNVIAQFFKRSLYRNYFSNRFHTVFFYRSLTVLCTVLLKC